MKTYFVGLLLRQKKDGTRVAQFEAARNKDLLSCEIYEYYGERVITKKALSQNIKRNHDWLLKEIQDAYPNYSIKKVLTTIA